MSEEVTVTVADGRPTPDVAGDVVVAPGKQLSGWEDVEITLRAESFPPSFRLAASSGMPTGRDAAIANGGDRCFVRIGGDLVVTGYITALAAQGDAGNHRVEIAGGGKTQDLVDCEINWEEARPYLTACRAAVDTIAGYLGLSVDAHANLPTLPTEYPIMLDFGTPAGDYVQQIARALGVLAYENSQGELVLATAGDTRAASGAVYGKNVEAFTVTNSMEGRFSEVLGTYFRQNQFLADEVDAANFFFSAKDPAVLRHRVKHVYLEAGPEGEDFAKRMALWQVARRAARGSLVRVVVDSWRDAAGTLWAPNTMVPLDLPGLKVPGDQFCLSEVTFRRNDQTGTTAEMLLMPVQGFTPEPVQLTNANLVGVAGGTAGD